MISNPMCGWCRFALENFDWTVSYLTEVPIDLLNAFIDYYTKGYGVTVFDTEGTYITLVMTRYNDSVYVIEEEKELVLYDFSKYRVDDLCNELINDIESDLGDWYNFLYSDDILDIKHFAECIDKKLVELKSIRNKRIRY